ncbi:MAG: calcium-binding protein, partial [Deltaproteobacteria bacterium]
LLSINENSLLIGMDQTDILYGGNGNDVLIGEAGDDVLSGGKGDDVLIGGAGNDTLNGGAGNDTMVGGAGLDTYYVDGNDRIIDSDGKGIILGKDGKAIAGAFIKQDDGSYQWAKDTQVTATKNSPLTIALPDGSTVVIEDYINEGDFGINLLDAPVDPTTTNSIIGDLQPILSNGQLQYDSLGNVITNSNQSPDREDMLYDSAGNDRIEAKGGNDTIWANNGGNDWLLGGASNDAISAFAGNDVAEGNAGADVVFGGTGNDQLFGEDYGEMAALIRKEKGHKWNMRPVLPLYSLSLFLLLLFSTVIPAQGDFTNSFVKPDCMPELNFFRFSIIHATNIEAIYRPFKGDKYVNNYLRDLKEKYNLYAEGPIVFSCKLPRYEITTKLTYNTPRARGECGARPGAYGQVIINGRIILGALFDNDCFTSVYFFELKGDSIRICARRSDSQNDSQYVCIDRSIGEIDKPLDQFLLKDN